MNKNVFEIVDLQGRAVMVQASAAVAAANAAGVSRT